MFYSGNSGRRRRANYRRRGIKKASALGYNFNFPHVPFGTHL